jgi:hypothetical protein
MKTVAAPNRMRTRRTLYADVVFDDFGKELQYSNQQDFTVRKVGYTITYN